MKRRRLVWLVCGHVVVLAIVGTVLLFVRYSRESGVDLVPSPSTILTNAVTPEERDFRGAIVRFICNTESTGRIDIAMFGFDADETGILGAIGAVHATCPVRVIVSDGMNNTETKRAIQGLKDAGAHVYYRPSMHSKFVVQGDRVLTGSTNWTHSSIDEMDNNMVIITNKDLAKQYQGEFDRLINDPKTCDESPPSDNSLPGVSSPSERPVRNV